MLLTKFRRPIPKLKSSKSKQYSSVRCWFSSQKLPEKEERKPQDFYAANTFQNFDDENPLKQDLNRETGWRRLWQRNDSPYYMRKRQDRRTEWEIAFYIASFYLIIMRDKEEMYFYWPVRGTWFEKLLP